MKKFTKNTEDFICEKCGAENKGNGYTNHCAKCLWSKHVDINPGDRAEECCGMMKPTAIEQKREDWMIVHICEKCGYKRRNRMTKEDSMEKAFEIAKNRKI